MTDEDVMPVFVIKAKDNLALTAIGAYARACEDHGLNHQAGCVRESALEIMAWRRNHPNLCKSPDHEHVMAGLPGSGSNPR